MTRLQSKGSKILSSPISFFVYFFVPGFLLFVTKDGMGFLAYWSGIGLASLVETWTHFKNTGVIIDD